MKKEEIKAKSELDANGVGVACHATQNAITLISLIITIVLLLILSAVVLNLIVGENGIFKLAQNAGKNYINAQDREMNELDKLYSSIQVADDSKVTLTMEELNNYINSKVDEKIQSTVEQLRNEITILKQNNIELQQKDVTLEELIKNVSDNKITFTFKELARSSSTTLTTVNLNDNLSNYKYVMVVRDTPYGYWTTSGIIPTENFKKISGLIAAKSEPSLARVDYVSDSKCNLLAGDSSTIAVLYGIK